MVLYIILKSLVANQLNKSNQNDIIWYVKKYLPNLNVKRAENFFRKKKIYIFKENIIYNIKWV